MIERKLTWLQQKAAILLGLQPKPISLKEAEAIVGAAFAIESRHDRSFGGHRHTGTGNPLLTELPLPSGWRKKP